MTENPNRPDTADLIAAQRRIAKLAEAYASALGADVAFADFDDILPEPPSSPVPMPARALRQRRVCGWQALR